MPKPPEMLNVRVSVVFSSCVVPLRLFRLWEEKNYNITAWIPPGIHRSGQLSRAILALAWRSGGAEHCQGGNTSLVHAAVFDWLLEKFPEVH